LFFSNAFKIYKRQGDEIQLASTVSSVWGGSDVIVEGGYAYVGSQSQGLFVFDISNPHSPRQLGNVPFPIYLRPMAKIGDRLYVAHTNYGIEVVDVSDPANPYWVDTIWVDGHDVVDGTSTGRLLIASDVSADRALFYSIDEQYRHTLVGTYQASEGFWDSAVHGSTLYLRLQGGGFEAVDIAGVAGARFTSLGNYTAEVVSRWGADTMVTQTAPYVLDVYDIPDH
jgi:hypothetical protein